MTSRLQPKRGHEHTVSSKTMFGGDRPETAHIILIFPLLTFRATATCLTCGSIRCGWLFRLRNWDPWLKSHLDGPCRP